MKRVFLSIALCGVLFGLIGGGCSSQEIELRETELLVIGGTTSGTTAAIAAARMGAQTLVVEQTPMLGGMLTAQGVCATDGNYNLPSGLWSEFRQHIRDYYGGAGAVWTGWVSTTLFEPHVADSIFKAMGAAEEKFDALYNYRLTDILRRGNCVTGAEFVNKEGHRLRVKAKMVIDATDIGESFPLCGLPYRIGLDARAETGEALAREEAVPVVQDLTLVGILKDFGADADRTIPEPEGYDPEEFAGCCLLADGSTITPEYMLEYGRMPNGKYMLNWPREGNDTYLDVVDLPYEEREEALRAARQKTLRFIYHIQHTLGFRNLGIADDEFTTEDGLAYLPYHREGRRMQGVVRMTLDDISDRYHRPLYRTGISVGDYPVDHHHNCHPVVGHIDFPPVPSFSVPLGALIPADCENLIVSDKAISVSNLANGATRLQPVVLLTGQAAGTLAALALRHECTPAEVPVREVQEALLQAGAYLEPLYDVTPEDPDFRTLQRIAATGILRMTGEPYGWANRTWFYPEEIATMDELTAGLHEYAPEIIVTADPIRVTAGRLLDLVKRAGGKPFEVRRCDLDRPLTRRQVALLLEESLDPFARPIDHNGNLIH